MKSHPFKTDEIEEKTKQFGEEEMKKKLEEGIEK